MGLVDNDVGEMFYAGDGDASASVAIAGSSPPSSEAFIALPGPFNFHLIQSNSFGVPHLFRSLVRRRFWCAQYSCSSNFNHYMVCCDYSE